MNYWLEISCRFCQRTNWVSLGNINDVTGVDIDAFKCWKCAEITILDDSEDYTDDIESRCYVEDGCANPCL